MTPTEIKTAYHLSTTGGKGTIAIIDAYDDATMGKNLGDFSKEFNLPACTIANGCFEKHKMSATESNNSGWALETTLDVEWAHAIAPSAKILLIEATTQSGANLLKAIDYAASRTDVVAVSMSWVAQNSLKKQPWIRILFQNHTPYFSHLPATTARALRGQHRRRMSSASAEHRSLSRKMAR